VRLKRDFDGFDEAPSRLWLNVSLFGPVLTRIHGHRSLSSFFLVSEAKIVEAS
jgi:hypothetical protein